MKLELRQRTPDETADIYAPGAVGLCETCKPILGISYPLWGVHLAAAVALHNGHRTVEGLRLVPAVSHDLERIGYQLRVVGPLGDMEA